MIEIMEYDRVNNENMFITFTALLKHAAESIT